MSMASTTRASVVDSTFFAKASGERANPGRSWDAGDRRSEQSSEMNKEGVKAYRYAELLGFFEKAEVGVVVPGSVNGRNEPAWG